MASFAKWNCGTCPSACHLSEMRAVSLRFTPGGYTRFCKTTFRAQVSDAFASHYSVRSLYSVFMTYGRDEERREKGGCVRALVQRSRSHAFFPNTISIMLLFRFWDSYSFSPFRSYFNKHSCSNFL